MGLQLAPNYPVEYPGVLETLWITPTTLCSTPTTLCSTPRGCLAHAVHTVHLSGGFLGLARMQARIARDQAYISARHRLPIPSSWSEDEAEGHTVPGSGNNTQTTRRAAGPLPPGDWLNLDPTNGTYGTFEGYFHGFHGYFHGPGSPVYLVQKGQDGAHAVHAVRTQCR